jgi:tRNA(Ile)-lysidine synthase
MNLFKSLPKHVGVAFSGGIDSVVLVHLLQSKGKTVTLFHYYHGREAVPGEYEFVKQFAEKFDLPLVVETQEKMTPLGESKEAYWSRLRNDFFQKQSCNICTGHHLNDVAEWYLMTALQGTGGYITPYSNGLVVRPLIAITKQQITDYATANYLKYFSDPTNLDGSNLRGKIRKHLIPAVDMITPGFLKAIKKRITK